MHGMNVSRLLRRCWPLVGFLLTVSLLPAQEAGSPLDTEKGRGPNVDGYPPYVELLEAKYISPAKEGDSQAIRLKFNISTDIPRGTIIHFSLQFLAMEVDSIDYTLKDENRRNRVLLWKPKKRLATGDYWLVTRIFLKKQPVRVQRAIKKNPKSFPPDFQPWRYLYMQEKYKIAVGGELEKKAEAERMCKIYTELMDELVDNMNEFVDKMDAVKDGKAFVKSGALDVKKFTDFVVKWRKKQGATQEKIAKLSINEPAFFFKSQTAYANLRILGQMVSKRSWQVQKEVTTQYNVPPINPVSHRFFDRNYRYKVSLEALGSRYDRILALVCPEETEDTAPEETQPAPAPAPAPAPK